MFITYPIVSNVVRVLLTCIYNQLVIIEYRMCTLILANLQNTKQDDVLHRTQIKRKQTIIKQQNS